MDNTLTLPTVGKRYNNMGDAEYCDYDVAFVRAEDGSITITLTAQYIDARPITVATYTAAEAAVIAERLAVALLRCERPTPGAIGLIAEVSWDIGPEDGYDRERIDIGEWAHTIVEFVNGLPA